MTYKHGNGTIIFVLIFDADILKYQRQKLIRKVLLLFALLISIICLADVPKLKHFSIDQMITLAKTIRKPVLIIVVISSSHYNDSLVLPCDT